MAIAVSQSGEIAHTLADIREVKVRMEHMGMGIPRKIFKPMEEQVGTVPELIVGEESFSLVLRRCL